LPPEGDAAAASVSDVIPDSHEARVLSGGLCILEARYGCFDNWVSVVGVLNKLIQNGRLAITVSNELAGDPAPRQPKSLIVRYQVGVTVYERAFSEGARVDLP
jgi:hypothetical protein